MVSSYDEMITLGRGEREIKQLFSHCSFSILIATPNSPTQYQECEWHIRINE